MKSRDPLLLFFSGVCMTLKDPLPLTYVFRHREEGEKEFMQEVNDHADANSLHMVWLKQCTQRDKVKKCGLDLNFFQ